MIKFELKEKQGLGICFECLSYGPVHYRHVVPEVYGGTQTVPLCEEHHGKVHQMDFLNHSHLVREGRKRWIEAGKPKKERNRRVREISESDWDQVKPTRRGAENKPRPRRITKKSILKAEMDARIAALDMEDLFLRWAVRDDSIRFMSQTTGVPEQTLTRMLHHYSDTKPDFSRDHEIGFGDLIETAIKTRDDLIKAAEFDEFLWFVSKETRWTEKVDLINARIASGCPHATIWRDTWNKGRRAKPLSQREVKSILQELKRDPANTDVASYMRRNIDYLI